MKKFEKPQVLYMDFGPPVRRCGDCEFWIDPKDTSTWKGECQTVEGEIEPNGTCLVWLPKGVRDAIYDIQEK